MSEGLGIMSEGLGMEMRVRVRDPLRTGIFLISFEVAALVWDVAAAPHLWIHARPC
jgi:hypothetical protein